MQYVSFNQPMCNKSAIIEKGNVFSTKSSALVTILNLHK